MTSDGKMLGELYNIETDVRSGEVVHLLVEPDEDVEYDHRFDVGEDGRYRVPTRCVQGVRDHVTVAQPR